MNMLTTAEAAAELGVSLQEVLRLLTAGRLAGAAMFGRQWAIPPAAIAAYRRTRRPPGNPNFTRRQPARRRPAKPRV